MRRQKFLSVFMAVFLLASTIGLFLGRLRIFDFVRLYHYTPDSTIVNLANDTTMNPTGRHLFYVYHPTFEDKSVFFNYCPDAEKTIVLGCYVSGSEIYLLNVQDVRLSGVEEVTAAHEMLHAAYERLSISQRKDIDQQTQAVFANLTDPRIKATVEDYRKQDPNIVPNELHSILGTEVRDLPPVLEKYYSRYFTNREQIVSYSENYEKTFTDSENQIKQYDAQLTGMKQQIDSLQASLQSQSASLNAQRSALDNQLAQGNVSAYNAQVDNFNTQVRAYNSSVEKVKTLIDQYNALVNVRNAAALARQQLIQAIDTTTVSQQQTTK